MGLCWFYTIHPIKYRPIRICPVPIVSDWISLYPWVLHSLPFFESWRTLSNELANLYSMKKNPKASSFYFFVEHSPIWNTIWVTITQNTFSSFLVKEGNFENQSKYNCIWKIFFVVQNEDLKFTLHSIMLLQKIIMKRKLPKSFNLHKFTYHFPYDYTIKLKCIII